MKINEIVTEAKKRKSKDPCWSGYEQIGMKDKNGKKVPNCVPKESVAEGLNDTVYPNAEVIKSKNGKPVGEIYQDGNEWGCFHYKADRGYDMIDNREDAIQALKDIHAETGRSRPDYTIKGMAEGKYKCSCHPGDADPDCPVHGLEPMEVGDALDESIIEESYDGDEFYEAYGDLWYDEEQLNEAEYQGRKVQLGKPVRSSNGPKKFHVFVKDPSTGNVKKVNFGDKNMRIKKSDPARRKSFRARHNCANPGPRTKAKYWSCRNW